MNDQSDSPTATQSSGSTPDDFQDLTGKRFNRITVVGPRDPSKPISKTNNQWWCVCDCTPDDPTRKFVVYRCRLINRNTQSCGCLSRQRLSEGRTKHGLCTVDNPHRLYSTWDGMISRCSQPNHSQWKYYGARGITVCDRWKENFKNFVDDMEPTWKEGLTLDRKETDMGYSPDNCRWSTPKEQQNNLRSNVRVEIDGETKTVMQWTEYFKINYSTVQARRRRGWTWDKSFKTPAAFQEDSPPVGNISFNGKSQSVPLWGKELGLKTNVIYARLKMGWSPERTLTAPIQNQGPRSASLK